MDKGLAVVTGASSGIGLAFARELVKRGYAVLAVARRKDRLDAELGDDPRIVTLVADLGTPEGVEALVERATRLGPVTLLVNNAGFGDWGRFDALGADRQIAAVRLNIEAVVALTRALVPDMLARKNGKIINVASTMAFQPMPFFAVYAATKAFVLSFTEALAVELAGTGVALHAICPGPVKTEFAHVAGSESVSASLPNLSAEDVVHAALRASDGGVVVRVLGAVNRIMSALPRLLPRFAMRALMGKILRPKERSLLPAT